MPKHKYQIIGLTNSGTEFRAVCIDNDIIHAINQFREIHYSVHGIMRGEQVNADEEIKIEIVVETEG